MANAKKCDRCGKFYEKYTKKLKDGSIVNGIIVIGSGFPVTDENFEDLCPECMKELEKWMEAKK